MTLLELCKANKDYYFFYSIDEHFGLWFGAQTIKKNQFGNEIPCDIDGDEFEPTRITHFIVELWVGNASDGDMLDNISNCTINKDFDIQYYVERAYAWLQREYETIADRNVDLSHEELSKLMYEELTKEEER